MNKWEDQKKNQMKNILKLKPIIRILNSRPDNAEKQANE